MMKASDIVALLADKHAKDVFVPECKTGPTWGSQMLRLDAWAMARSWSKPTTWGYEVKVSRGDFLADEKWRGYLDYCNRFSFVCPPKLIAPQELPAGVGLIYVTKTGTRLITKRKAHHRDVEVPEELFRYVLMSRTNIVRNMWDANGSESKADYWRRWLIERRVDRDFGDHVGRAIGERVREEVLKAREENKALRRQVESLEEVSKFLAELDIDPTDAIRSHREYVRDRLDDARRITRQLPIHELKRLQNACANVARELECLERDAQKPIA